MIQIMKHSVPVPAILTCRGIVEKADLCSAFKTGKITFEFNSDIYGHSDVKSSLKIVQSGKCCFCEAKIDHISFGDVEHFRPKAGWVQEKEKINQPGYYWLAYEWGNLFLSCQLCNQRHKKNFFPLADNTKRALSHEHDISAESPVFIKPDVENPEKFIEFREEIPFPVEDNERGQQTICRLGLDREALNENRRSKLFPIRILYDLAKDIPETTLEIKQKAINQIKKIASEYTADDAEYSAMFRAFFRSNPIDF